MLPDKPGRNVCSHAFSFHSPWCVVGIDAVAAFLQAFRSILWLRSSLPPESSLGDTESRWVVRVVWQICNDNV